MLDRADKGGGVNGSLFDAPYLSVTGIAWIGCSVGLAVGGLWIESGLLAVLGGLALLYGDGFRVTRRKEPD